MKKTIQINGDGNVNVTWDVIGFLKNLKNGNDYYWKVLWLDTDNTSPGSGYEEFEEKVKESKMGLEITWADLLFMSKSIFQISDLLIVANKDGKTLIDVDRDNFEGKDIEYIIELSDSSFWFVTADEERLKPFMSLTGVSEVKS